MHNPYAHVPTPAPSTPEEQRTADYESAIGPNTGYYLTRFAEFDAGESKAGWHWPAFFATSGWFIYRKMWAVGMLNLFWPLIAHHCRGADRRVPAPGVECDHWPRSRCC